jgi:hypothetical protein
MMIFGEGRAVTKIIQDKENFELTTPLRSKHIARVAIPPWGLGSALVIFMITQSLVAIVLCQFKRRALTAGYLRRRCTIQGTALNLSDPFSLRPMLRAMNPLAAFTMLIATAQSLVAAVNTRDDLHLRPEVARKAVAARLVSGLAVLRAFLRRLILLIALDLEWGLVDTRGVMKRPHGRKAKSSTKLNLRILDADKPSLWLGGNCPKFAMTNNSWQGQRDGYNPPVYVDMAKLYAQLNFLTGIAANPHAEAKRLAFHLARTRQGIIMAPEGPDRIAGRWGTEVNAHFYAMAGSIMTKSRNRPPPLPPPRTHWPTITAL